MSSSKARHPLAKEAETVAKEEDPGLNATSDAPAPGLVRAESSTSDTAPKTRKKRLGVDPSLIISEERSKRRRTPSPEPAGTGTEAGQGRDAKDPVKAKELGTIIYNRILASKGSDGEDMSQPFIKLPNKRAFPDYYETIKHPMSLEMVHAKLEATEYQTLKDVCSDLGQIFNNAKRYNMKESLIFQYAKKLHKMTRVYYTNTTSPDKVKDESDSEGEHETATPSAPVRTAQPPAAGEGYDDDQDAEGEVDPEGEGDADENGDGDVVMADGTAADGGSTSGSGRAGRKRGTYMKAGPSVYKLIKPVLKAIKDAKARDGSGRDIAAIFMKLPERRDLPDYYKTIRTPISLEEIEAKQLGRRYETWQEFFDDVELMCNNAMEYNEDESEVFKDARQIKELLATYRAEVMARLANPNAPKISRYKLQQQLTPRPAHLAGPSYPPSPAMAMYGQSPHGGHLPSPSYLPPSGPSIGANLGMNQVHLPAGTHSPSMYRHHVPGYPPGPSVSAPRQGPVPYLPALPPGVVTEEVVNSLERYPLYEQQAWAQSLTPAAMAMYRTMLANHEARKRGIGMGVGMGAPPTPSPSPYTRPQMPASQISNIAGSPRPSSLSDPTMRHPGSAGSFGFGPPGAGADAQGRTLTSPMGHVPSPSPAVQPQPPMPKPEKTKPLVPTVQYFDFVFSSPGEAVHLRKAIRLKNLRGVVTHSVILDSTTSEIELTAYIDEPSSSSANGASATSPTLPPSAVVPELSLRINGNQGSLPRFVYPSSGSGSAPPPPPSPTLTLTGAEGINGAGGQRPKGMRWSFHVASNKLQSRIEVIATKPGSLAETTTIYVSRQF